jgi:flavin-dependent dehydrogenase
MSRDADAVVVGGGPAGAAAAAWLAEVGRRVVLFEREPGPHQKVCGEFVSVEAAGYLADLGVDLPGLGAVPVERIRAVAGRTMAEAALPFPAFSLSRAVMDEALLRAAAERGVDLRRGMAVRALEADARAGGVRTVLAGGEAVRAGVGFLATGKHDLRGHRRPAGGENDLIGFKMHLEPAPEQRRAIDGVVEVVLFPGGYAGLQPSAGGRANLCLLVRKPVYERLGRNWPDLLAHMAAASPIFAGRLAGARFCAERPLSIYGVPYGFVHRAGGEEGPLYRIGDQLAVIPSFCGDGMAIALHSARRAVDHRLSGDRTPFDGRDYRGQIATAMGMSWALRWPGLHGPLVGLCRLAPSLLAGFATWTRCRVAL